MRGLRPVRAERSIVVNLPKFIIITSSFCASASPITSNRTSTVSSVPVWPNSVRLPRGWQAPLCPSDNFLKVRPQYTRLCRPHAAAGAASTANTKHRLSLSPDPRMHHPLFPCGAAWPSRASPNNYPQPASRRSRPALPDREARGPENGPLRRRPGDRSHEQQHWGRSPPRVRGPDRR